MDRDWVSSCHGFLGLFFWVSCGAILFFGAMLFPLFFFLSFYSIGGLGVQSHGVVFGFSSFISFISSL